MRTANGAGPLTPSDDATPRPRSLAPVGGAAAPPAVPATPPPPPPADARPTPEVVLRWVAAAGPAPWFPSAHAAAAGTDRDALDEPLGELRRAGLVKVATWVRGVGQGYALTPGGEMCVRNPDVLARFAAGPPDLPPPSFETPPPKPAAPAAAGPRTPPVPLDLRPPIVTPALLIANLVWFAVGAWFAWKATGSVTDYLGPRGTPTLHRLGSVSGADLLRGDWWRLGTAAFVHVGFVHLLVNMFALGMTGSLAEVLWGRWKVFAVYALSAVAGSCLAAAIQPDVPMAGASGAIWGLQTSLVAWLVLYRDRLPPALVADWSRRLGLMFVLNAGFSLLPGISWEAHAGGGLAGFLAAGLLNALSAPDRPRRLAAAALLCALPALCVGGLVLAMRSTDPWQEVRAKAAWYDQARRKAERHTPADADRLRARLKAFEVIAPTLNALRPGAVQPLLLQVAVANLRPTPPAVRDRLRADIAPLHLRAAALAAALAEPPTGDPGFDNLVGTARAFADTRRRLFEGMLKELELPRPADAPGTKALGKLWADGNRFWDALPRQADQPPAPPPDDGGGA